MKIYLLTLDEEPMTDQSQDITKVQLNDPVSLLGLLRGMWMRAYLQEQK